MPKLVLFTGCVPDVQCHPRLQQPIGKINQEPAQCRLRLFVCAAVDRNKGKFAKYCLDILILLVLIYVLYERAWDKEKQEFQQSKQLTSCHKKTHKLSYAVVNAALCLGRRGSPPTSLEPRNADSICKRSHHAEIKS